jgi:hypothetical protein
MNAAGSLDEHQKYIPMVGMVVTTSPSLSLYTMVVFPAAELSWVVEWLSFEWSLNKVEMSWAEWSF